AAQNTPPSQDPSKKAAASSASAMPMPAELSSLKNSMSEESFRKANYAVIHGNPVPNKKGVPTLYQAKLTAYDGNLKGYKEYTTYRLNMSPEDSLNAHGNLGYWATIPDKNRKVTIFLLADVSGAVVSIKSSATLDQDDSKLSSFYNLRKNTSAKK